MKWTGELLFQLYLYLYLWCWWRRGGDIDPLVMRLHGEQTSLRCGEPSACPACPFFCICISQFPCCISVFVHIFDFTWIASGYVSDCECEGSASQLQLLLTGSKIKTFETWTTGIVGEPHKTNLRWNDTTKKRRHCKTQSPGHKAIWNSYEKTGGVEAGTRLNIFIMKQIQEWNWSTQSE